MLPLRLSSAPDSGVVCSMRLGGNRRPNEPVFQVDIERAQAGPWTRHPPNLGDSEIDNRNLSFCPLNGSKRYTSTVASALIFHSWMAAC